MGGKAFIELGENAFPRIAPRVYTRLKDRFTEQLKTLYKFVGVPAEAPEKEDYGDVDFIVCEPFISDLCTLAGVKEVLGAEHTILAEGNRTSNFAVPAGDELGAQSVGTFFQVDVHVCSNKAEWDRTLFFHSYGDLGMILGLLARTYDFTLGTKGFRTHFAQPDDTRISSFLLSESFHDILPFFHLSMEEWEGGFPTLSSVFSWVQTSRFFEPRRIAAADPTKAKKAARQQRKMYSAFLEFSHALAIAKSESPSTPDCDRLLSNTDAQYEEPETGTLNTVSQEEMKANDDHLKDTKAKLDRASLLEEALIYFGKKDAYDALVAENVRRRALREKLNGTQVIAWTGLHGIAVKWVMDDMRERLSNDDIITMQEEDIRELALQVQKKLNLFSGNSAPIDKGVGVKPSAGSGKNARKNM